MVTYDKLGGRAPNRLATRTRPPMTEINKTEHELKSSAGETPNLKSVIGQRDPSDVDVFGWQIIYTTGEFTIGREDLLDKMDDLGLPDYMKPSAVAPHRAYSRALTDAEEEFEEFTSADGQRVRVEFESGESHYEQHVHLKRWEDPDEDNNVEGKWRDTRLGVLHYEDKDIWFHDDYDDPERGFGRMWHAIKQYLRGRFETHQELHNGKDVNNIVYYLCRQWTKGVKLRDSCYFIPATYEDVEEYIDSFRTLYQWLDDTADKPTGGQETELFAINIVDSEREEEMVRQKVQREMEDDVSNIYDSIIDRVRGGEAENIAEDVVREMNEVHGLMEAHSVNDEMKAALSVKQAMRRALNGIGEDDKQEVVESVLADAGLEVEEDEADAVPA